MENPLALIVEDDEDLLLVFSEAVQKAGYQIEAYAAGEKALERLEETIPHLVVLDLHLPGVTGPQILNFIRSEKRLKDLRVIITSADDRLSEQLRDRTTMVLLKPVSFSQLSELAQRLLRTSSKSPPVDP